MTTAPPTDTPPNESAMCASCAGIQQHWRKAPGHAELIQTSNRKAERSDGDQGGRTVTITSYRCDACGTRWEYENDKGNQRAGWSVKAF